MNKCELCEDEAMTKESRFCYDCALKFKKGLDEGFDLGYAQCLRDENLDLSNQSPPVRTSDKSSSTHGD